MHDDLRGEGREGMSASEGGGSRDDGAGRANCGRKRRRSENERTRLVRSPDLRRIGWRSGGGRREEAREGVDDGVARGAEGQETNLVCGRLRAVGVGALLEAAEPLRGERRLGWGTVGRDAWGSGVRGGAGKRGGGALDDRRVANSDYCEDGGEAHPVRFPAGAKGQVGERARRSVGHGTCRIGMGVEEKIALSGRPGFRRRARTRRASGRAKRGITREPREKESAPLVSIGSRTSGTVRTRHADYVSRGVCFSRGRLSADPGIKSPVTRDGCEGRGVCLERTRGADTGAMDRSPIEKRDGVERSTSERPRGVEPCAWNGRCWFCHLAPFHTRDPERKRARASCPTDRRCGKIRQTMVGGGGLPSHPRARISTPSSSSTRTHASLSRSTP